jgi:anti-sigma factor RsiW
MTRRGSNQCDLLIERLSAYLDGDLGRAACDRIRAHAGTCQRCGVLITDLQRTVGICRAAGRAPLPGPVRARAKKYIEALLGLPLRDRRTTRARTTRTPR